MPATAGVPFFIFLCGPDVASKVSAFFHFSDWD
jgi:hypothetical protein